MKEKIVDLHIHSFYSDGTMSPQEIVTKALTKGVGLLAIADHNTLEGNIELSNLSEKYKLDFISAVELDSIDNGVDVHILGYGIEVTNQEFCDFVDSNKRLLEEVNIRLIEKMENDFKEISVSEYITFQYDRKLGGWKALHYFMHKNLTVNLMDGIKFYSKYGNSYSSVNFPDIKTVCESIHRAGGKAILAHPGLTIKSDNIPDFKKEVLRMVNMGLDGIECYYPLHSNEVISACVNICRDKDLIITTGSDYHGSFIEDAEIGEMDIPKSKLVLKDLV
ncbi:PHP domain-containing protein [Vallitalea okinawensis]|uniref:PHP domain-containing protein n=1 Tax=Vallitalea okinawensis TaxID=2078660 RepID=UPI000CFD2734|nr:PHP domain-containing protein [Vallitalea okinawensis]